MITYPFPLRADVTCYLTLPADLRIEEAHRLIKAIEAVSFEGLGVLNRDQEEKN
jgi:hypothetical protein